MRLQRSVYWKYYDISHPEKLLNKISRVVQKEEYSHVENIFKEYLIIKQLSTGDLRDFSLIK